eukprot:12404341-Karenia_brevis.AAC.1
MYWGGLENVFAWTLKMYSDDFEDVQRKDERRCSEEGVTKMFRGRINDRCSEGGVTEMFRGR